MRLGRHGRPIDCYGGPDKKSAQELFDHLDHEQDRLEFLDEQPKVDIACDGFSESYLTWAKRALTTLTFSSRQSMSAIS